MVVPLGDYFKKRLFGRSRGNHPIVDGTLLRVETNTDFNDTPLVRLIGHGIATGVNLVKSLLGCTIHFQFHHIDSRGHKYDEVCTPLGAVHLGP